MKHKQRGNKISNLRDKQSKDCSMNKVGIAIILLSIVRSAARQNVTLMKKYETFPGQNIPQPCNCRIYDQKCQSFCFGKVPPPDNMRKVEILKDPASMLKPADIGSRRDKFHSDKPFIRFVERNIGRNLNDSSSESNDTIGAITDIGSSGIVEKGDNMLSYNGMTYRLCDLYDWADRSYISRGYLNLRGDLKRLYDYVRNSSRISRACKKTVAKRIVSPTILQDTTNNISVPPGNLEFAVNTDLTKKGLSTDLIGDRFGARESRFLDGEGPMVNPPGVLVREPLTEKEIVTRYVSPVVVERTSVRTVPVFINESLTEETPEIKLRPVDEKRSFADVNNERRLLLEPSKEFLGKVAQSDRNAAAHIASTITLRTTSTITTTKIASRSSKAPQELSSEHAEPRTIETTTTTTTRVIKKQDGSLKRKDTPTSKASQLTTTVTVLRTVIQDQQLKNPRESPDTDGDTPEWENASPSGVGPPPTLTKKSLGGATSRSDSRKSGGLTNLEVLEKIKDLLSRTEKSEISSGKPSVGSLGSIGLSQSAVSMPKSDASMSIPTTTLTVERAHTTTIYKSSSSVSTAQSRSIAKETDKIFDEATRELIKSIFELLKKNEAKTEPSTSKKESLSSISPYKEAESKLKRLEAVGILKDNKNSSFGKPDISAIRNKIDLGSVTTRGLTITSTVTELITKTRSIRAEAQTIGISTVKNREPEYGQFKMPSQNFSPLGVTSGDSALDNQRHGEYAPIGSIVSRVVSSEIHNSSIKNYRRGAENGTKESVDGRSHDRDIRDIYKRLMASEEREQDLMSIIMSMDRKNKVDESILEVLRNLYVSNGSDISYSRNTGLHSSSLKTLHPSSSISDSRSPMMSNLFGVVDSFRSSNNKQMMKEPGSIIRQDKSYSTMSKSSAGLKTSDSSSKVATSSITYLENLKPKSSASAESSIYGAKDIVHPSTSIAPTPPSEPPKSRLSVLVGELSRVSQEISRGKEDLTKRSYSSQRSESVDKGERTVFKTVTKDVETTQIRSETVTKYEISTMTVKTTVTKELDVQPRSVTKADVNEDSMKVFKEELSDFSERINDMEKRLRRPKAPSRHKVGRGRRVVVISSGKDHERNEGNEAVSVPPSILRSTISATNTLETGPSGTKSLIKSDCTTTVISNPSLDTTTNGVEKEQVHVPMAVSTILPESDLTSAPALSLPKPASMPGTAPSIFKTATVRNDVLEPSISTVREIQKNGDPKSALLELAHSSIQPGKHSAVAIDEIVTKIKEKAIPNESLLVSDSDVIDKIVEKLAPLVDDIQDSEARNEPCPTPAKSEATSSLDQRASVV